MGSASMVCREITAISWFRSHEAAAQAFLHYGKVSPMPVVGNVTATGASDFFTQGLNNIGNTGGVAFIARKVDGQNLGSYRTAGEAINAFRRLFGPARIQQVRRRDLRAGVENYEIIGYPLDPTEVWQEDLLLWYEPSISLAGILLADAALQTIFRVTDLSGGGEFATQATPADQPTLVSSAPGFNGHPVIDFDEASTQLLTVPNVTSVGIPFTLIAVASSDAPVGVSRNLVEMGGATPFRLGVDFAGDWTLTNGGVPIVDGPSSSNATILVVKQSATGAEMRVNGVVVGSNAGVPSATTIQVGDDGITPWGGRLALLMVVREADPDNIKILLSERYARERYQ